MKDKSQIEDFYSSNQDKDEVPLGNIFRLVLMQSKLIILIVFLVKTFGNQMEIQQNI